jgi:hypothetical protein
MPVIAQSSLKNSRFCANTRHRRAPAGVCLASKTLVHLLPGVQVCYEERRSAQPGVERTRERRKLVDVCWVQQNMLDHGHEIGLQKAARWHGGARATFPGQPESGPCP